MNKQRIKIVTDNGLPERSARIHLKTWRTVKTRKGNNAFFPEGDTILVGANPFDPDYILFAVDDQMPEDMFVVSADVKERSFPSIDYFEL